MIVNIQAHLLGIPDQSDFMPFVQVNGVLTADETLTAACVTPGKYKIWFVKRLKSTCTVEHRVHT